MNKKDILDKIKSLDGLNNEERAYLVNLVNTKKKYGLVWEDKPEQVEEELRTKLPILKEVKERAIVNDTDNEKHPNHILIEGDNLHALTALTFTHENKIDAIYIDPPYNTGAKDWKYNNDYVDSTDPYRHSKWLSLMEKRLRIAKRLLSDEGIICVTIDDYEVQRLWCLLDELFNEKNHLGTAVIRINPGGRKSKRKLALQHEYAIFYSKSFETKVCLVDKPIEEKSHSYKKDKDGTYYEERNLRKEGSDSLAERSDGTLLDRYYPIYYDPVSGQISTKVKLAVEILPHDTKGAKRIWRRGKDAIDNMYENNELSIKKTKYGIQVYFKFKGGLKGEPPKSFWEEKIYSASEYGTKALNEIMNERETFPFPKSPYAVRDCLKIMTNKKDAVVLDFFAGSGTTLHTVVEMNKSDNGSRSCIIVTNNENNICEDVTYVRAKRAIQGLMADEEVLAKPNRNNNLRYFKCAYIDRESTIQNKRQLTKLATELLCIKENCYHDETSIINHEKWNKFFTNGKGKYVYVVYDDFYTDEAVEALTSFVTKEVPSSKIKVYVFANGQYAYAEEFEDIAENITLAALPDAIYKAYQNVLPKENKEFIPELEEDVNVEPKIDFE